MRYVDSSFEKIYFKGDFFFRDSEIISNVAIYHEQIKTYVMKILSSLLIFCTLWLSSLYMILPSGNIAVWNLQKTVWFGESIIRLCALRFTIEKVLTFFDKQYINCFTCTYVISFL